jgi:hypothetical protein
VCARSRLEGDESEFNLHNIRRKRNTQTAFEALIKKNSEFYIPPIQTDESEI